VKVTRRRSAWIVVAVFAIAAGCSSGSSHDAATASGSVAVPRDDVLKAATVQQGDLPDGWTQTIDGKVGPAPQETGKDCLGHSTDLRILRVAQGAEFASDQYPVHLFSSVVFHNDAAALESADGQATDPATFKACVTDPYLKNVAPSLGQTNVQIESGPPPAGAPFAYSTTHYSFTEPVNGAPTSGTKDCVNLRRGPAEGTVCVEAAGQQDNSGVLDAAATAMSSRLPD
jgi:hypothetical protein